MGTIEEAMGPAPCFPSIEKTCGQPVAHRFALLDGGGMPKHGGQAAFLGSRLEPGHGHANAWVVYTPTTGVSCGERSG